MAFGGFEDEWSLLKESIEIRDLGSISPTFYEQLLRVQRSQKRKKQLNLTVFLALLGSVRVKAAHKTLTLDNV